jgi:hypothetical protein
MDTAPVRLGDLIASVERQRPEGALDRLADAVLAAEHLGELADRLVGHFVEQARGAGASWAEIGQSLGVTKQAAQQRFVPRRRQEEDLLGGGVSDRLTDRARSVVAAAVQEARDAGHDYVGTEHLVLGLLHEPEALGARALQAQGVSLDAVRDAVTAVLGPARDPVPGHIPFTPRAKKVRELAVREALRLGHDRIGTEHILLGLLRDSRSLGATVLAELGVTRRQSQDWIVATRPPDASA